MTGDQPLRALGELAESLLPALTAIRRDLHRHPEPGWLEFRTTGVVARHLRTLGYGVRVGAECLRVEDARGVPAAEIVADHRHGAGETAELGVVSGVVAELDRGPGPTLALRFDMDATQVTESGASDHRPASEGFASGRDGVMHACGHDGHVAIGLGVADLLTRTPDWRGRLRLIFQPAEEGGRGAWPMVTAGVVDDVDVFAALHIADEALAPGEIALSATGFLASVKLDVEFRGVAAHAAGAPERGRNALLAAAQAALALHALPRHGHGATFVNAGVLRAGTGRNVVADRALLQCEVRGGSDAICRSLDAAARRVVAGAAAMQGVEVDVRVVGETIGGHSDPELVARLGAVARALPTTTRIRESHPLGGGEDATFFMRRVQERGGQALYFLLGGGSPSGHHSSTFDFDERALAHGAALLAGLALDRLVRRSPAGP
jgi:aminobenzoyl-glutamate utilization protein A